MHTPHAGDAERVRALERYEVLDSPVRRQLETLVELAAKFTGVPMATINLITDSEQVQVATYGFTGGRSRREDSFCTTVVEEQQPIIVEDARLDPRFATNPHTTGELGSIRFYGSHPLVTPEGVTIGALCVYDEETRRVTPEIAEAMETLADRVIDLLELELTSRRLAAANERLGAFAGQVSHDLRNPLTSIQMSIALAREHVKAAGEGSPVGELLARAERGASRMGEMIDDLLTFARVGSSIEPTLVDLGATVREVVEDLADAAAAHPLEVQDLPNVLGDPVQLRVVMQNLLSNAMKFSPPGSRVVVSADVLDHGWRIAVSDLGPGVPLADRERAFDPMVRLNPAVPGTGIGLATCRRIVEAHGGRIGLSEAPDGGSRVWFELPDAQPQS